MKSRFLIIIVSLFLCSSIFASEDIKIISSTSTYVVVQYTAKNLDTSKISSGNENFVRVSLDNCLLDPTVKIGEPQILTRTLNLGVPNEFGNTIQIIGSESISIKGSLFPRPDLVKDGTLNNEKYVASGNYSSFVNPELVSFGEFDLIRELQVQNINIHPVQFDPRTKTIKVYTKIIFRINYATPVKQLYPIKSDGLLKDLIVNFKIAQNWGVEENSLRKTTSNSVLATGTWYRFEAPDEGIYKITRSMLPELGIDPNTVDPRTIKIYNNGGYILPQTVNAPRPNGLTENAIFVEGEGDGKFDDNDYILLYGRGVDFWEYNTTKGKILRNKNWYSKHNYYWITSGGNPGKRMEVQNSLDEPNPTKQTSTKSFKFLDDDKTNLLRSGLIDVGDEFSANARTKTYVNTLSELIPDSGINYSFQFVNSSSQQNTLSLEENDKTIFSSLLPRISGSLSIYIIGKLYKNQASYSGVLPDNRSVLKFVFSPRDNQAKGYLDYFEIRYYAKLRAVDNYLLFFSDKTSSNVQYTISNFSSSNILTFNVTDYKNVKLISGSSLNGGTITFQTSETNRESRSRYIALEKSAFKSPANFKKMENSNIHAIASGAKYIIISNKVFKEQAERLKKYRESESPYPISTALVYVDEIFNEFSMGMVDPTAIRDFIMYAYNNWTVKPEYILLFGDGDFDYDNILGLNVNFVPTYQTMESMNEINSYTMDDYYSRIVGNNNSADVAIGRLPAANVNEAESIVDKIIKYEKGSDRTLWRNTITLVADDGLTSKGDDGSLHTGQSENLSRSNIPSFFDQDKIYLSAYPTVVTGSGRRKPEVNKAIINAMNNGALIVNFIGHGSPELWTHEDVFDRETSFPQLSNKDYFFLTAATCDFGKYDDPENQSATEELIFMKDRGIIGGLTAVRPVYSNENASLNSVFYTKLFKDRDEEGLPRRIGEAYFQLKQNKTGNNDEKFHLLCDPVLRLDQPVLPAKIDSINHEILTTDIQIKALGNVLLSGTVLNVDSSFNNFNGNVIVTVFDSRRRIELKDINYFMDVQGGVIFRGQASVENGKFSTGFIVPKDISYENKNGKIVTYFFNDNADGVGFTNNIIVGGTDSSRVNDHTGPKIQVFYDDEKFKDSYLVNPNFTLIVKLNDETGLNTTGLGVGHKLEAMLNDDSENPIDLTNYFIGDLNSFGKSGIVKYSFNSLAPGNYKIKIKAWDVFNNFSTQESSFQLVDDNNMVLRDVFNYPNPFSNFTAFTFQQNLTKPLDIIIKIYTISGRLIKTITKNNIPEKFVKINWDGRDEDGSIIANGTYFYKLNVKTVDGNYNQNLLGKLAVIR